MEEKEFAVLVDVDANLFEVFWSEYKDRDKFNKEFIKKAFLSVDMRYKMVISDSNVTNVLLKNVGVYDVVSYIIAEHVFHLSLVAPEKRPDLEKDEKYFQQLVNVCYDKLLTNELSRIDSMSVISKYSVETSLIEMYSNRVLRVLREAKITDGSMKGKLEGDMLTKCFLLVKSILGQLCDGLETEAMSSWRNLFELVCVLRIIDKSDDVVAKAYFRHLDYGALNRGEVADPVRESEIQEMINKDMEALQVKTKDKVKFINYGWLHWAYKTYNEKPVKMNFLGGVQLVAEMDDYKEFYELASDVTHSTPLCIYVNKNNLTTTILKITYEIFFKIEELFLSYCQQHCSLNETNKTFNDYLKFRINYKPKVEIVYRRINTIYNVIIKSKKEKKDDVNE